MNFVGIIAEYDPFHSGHALQLRMLRQRGASTIAVCMSTGVVQRGGVPILPEAVRVRAALAAGADLVVALPAPYANASAEQFAAAGVHLLAALGCDTLAFGAETPEPAPLQAAAAALCSAAFPAALRSQLESGLPFAAARAAAAETLYPGAADLLQTPNNILGIEYCKAILRQGAAMQLLPLPRLGAAHGTAQTGQVQGQALASASHIRQLVHTQGIKAASPFVPQAAMELYRQAAEQGQLVDPEKFSTAVLTLLRTKTPEQLSTLRGAGEGLENRLYAAAREAETVNDLYDRLKTKRYPTARLRRLVLDAVLDVPAAGLPALPPYLLVLGAKRSALPLLKHAKIPAGTSLAGLAGQDQKLQIAADMHSKAVDFSLLCRYKIQPMGHAYTAHVVLL